MTRVTKSRCDLSSWQAAPGEAERPIFAIGDVHGRFDLLTILHEEIQSIITRDGLTDPLIVHLGDYIDRGPQPIDCLRRVLQGVDGVETVTLAGNHEQFMHRFLAAMENESGNRATRKVDKAPIWDRWRGADLDEEDPVEVMQSWFDYNCGTAVARELGFSDPAMAFRLPAVFHERLVDRLGAEMLRRFLALPNHFKLGDYFFIHGGLHPAISLAEQLTPHWGSYRFDAPETDPLWVRGPFLTHPGSFEFDGEGTYADYRGPFIVVHGHTISERPEVRPNRIGIDTGAFMTGQLTAVELRGDKLRFVSALGHSVPWGEY